MKLFWSRLQDFGPKPDEHPEHRYFKITVLALIGVVALTFIAGLATFLLSLRGAEETMVPDVERVELVDALVSLQERNLYPQIQLRYFSDPTLKGKVVQQEPAPGTSVRAGKRISLVVSQGAVVDTVGEYVGRNLDDVRSELRTLFSSFDAVLTIDDVSYVFDDAEPGTILEQDPPPGTELTGPRELDFVVSRGPDVRRQELPAYVGLNWREAVPVLARSDTPFTFTVTEDPQALRQNEPGIIVDQTPEPGTEIAGSTNVQLTITPGEASEEDNVFGVFDRTLPSYAVAVDLSLVAVRPDGDEVTLLSMVHPGGRIGVPYDEPVGTTLVLYRFDTEVVRTVVRTPDEDEQEE